MGFIRCSENCVHQTDGYCSVEKACNAAADADAPCEYYKCRSVCTETEAENLQNE